jgi:hypothetical protein
MPQDRRRLYELEGDLLELDRLLSDPELDVDARAMVEGWFQTAGEAFKEKVGGYWYVVKSLEADAAFAKSERDRLDARQRALTLRAEGMKTTLRDTLVRLGLKKIPGHPYTVSLVNNGGLAPLEIESDTKAEDLPKRYQKVTYDYDLQAIREDLEAGRPLPFARIGERGVHVRGSEK